jgi:hypothetical protein
MCHGEVRERREWGWHSALVRRLEKFCLKKEHLRGEKK